ncbi:RsmB/NOP family class I SAM-dependent RNA methyltransferase [bacterium]|nr:RsmB/NOP family class I SAM-dependent RNA methyltransferase [bacterium]
MTESLYRDFDEFYKHYWGARWPALKEALLKEPLKIERPNAFKGMEAVYIMDKASVFPAMALDVQASDQVLDMCAAPGGKSLILAEALGEGGHLIANEFSRARRDRLTQVIRDYVPENIRKERISVTGRDGSLIGVKEKEKYDRILLDAPCSGERHLLHDEGELKKWSPKRTKQLAQKQYALLCSALLALKSGGRLVYSTCALSPLENDAVVSRVLEKGKIKISIIRNTHEIGDATEHGWQILPDTTGFGPIYFCVVEKK